MDVAVAFGKVIRDLRRGAGLTQEQLGFEADLRRTFVSLLELGEQQPSLTTLFKIADPLGVSPAEIIRQVETLVSADKNEPQKKPRKTGSSQNGKDVHQVKGSRK